MRTKAYSHGLGGYEIAEFLQHHHIDYLGVAYADEGVDLKKMESHAHFGHES